MSVMHHYLVPRLFFLWEKPWGREVRIAWQHRNIHVGKHVGFVVGWSCSQSRPQGFSHFLLEKPWGRGCRAVTVTSGVAYFRIGEYL